MTRRGGHAIRAAMDLGDYETGPFFDEMFEAPGVPRPGSRILADRFRELPLDEIQRRQTAAERALLTMGITFNVYGDAAGTEKIFPFDLIPRIVEHAEWERIERGLAQRIRALNLFIADCYGDQRILKEKIVPRELVESSKGFLKPCVGLRPPRDVWCHITGTDLVRDGEGQFLVLEDNLRCPSGVSYVLENRQIMKQTFPKVFEASRVRPVDTYPSRLLETLERVAPPTKGAPVAALLTPGVHNSAYFEHSFLAQKMGIELVEGRDLVVEGGHVHMRTTRGLERVDVIYRRIDDTFLDPLAFRPDSMLGVPGLMEVYAKGNVTLANAPGTGIADDKVIYAYVPKMIRFYLSEEPILPNVPTYVCHEPKDLAYVLEHLPELVVKAANESGGYGMLIGPASTAEQRDLFATRLRAEPRNYIAQPTLALSRVPTLIGDHLEGRHVDLRPYVLYGQEIFVLPGGLTRVAITKGSLVVNSSQGGGSKDTWVLHDPSLNPDSHAEEVR
ncbi:MAG: circularly permuted type 2 ATP-grasp protein [Polyangiales bacterium]